MDRYFVWHSLFAQGQPRWLVVDRVMGGWDRETGDRHVASCPDPEMAQRIADLLNFNQHVDIKWIGDAYRLTASDMRL